MNQREPSTDLLRAFTNGLRGQNYSGDAFSIQVEQIGELLVTSGSIVACDPLWLQTAPQAYTTRVPPGHYPILLSIANSIVNWVACAQLRLNEQEVVRWEMALRPGQDPSTLKPGSFFGYGVDAGMGCFLDLDVLEWVFEQAGIRDLDLWRRLSRGPDAYTPEELEEIREFIEPARKYIEEAVHQRLETEIGMDYTTCVTLNETTGGNIIIFRSGEGDGSYASFFGYAADGSLSCLVTDFGVLHEAQWNEPVS